MTVGKKLKGSGANSLNENNLLKRKLQSKNGNSTSNLFDKEFGNESNSTRTKIKIPKIIESSPT